MLKLTLMSIKSPRKEVVSVREREQGGGGDGNISFVDQFQ